MNKRIEKLATEVGISIEYLTNTKQLVLIEKFAELIVRECVDVLKKDMELAHIQLIPLDFKMYANGRLQRTIKEHFGVNS